MIMKWDKNKLIIMVKIRESQVDNNDSDNAGEIKG